MGNLVLVEVKSRDEKKRFCAFRRRLYNADLNYVCTADYLTEPFLNGSTVFARTCEVIPLFAEINGKIIAECIIIFDKCLPMIQLAFFEAEKNANAAVDLFLDYAYNTAKKYGVNKIVIGLNGHLSYGVGILTEGFEFKNSFDSIYNKPYYDDYFENRGFKRETLSTYKCDISGFIESFPNFKSDIKVRHASLSDFKNEMEILRQLCDRSIGKTHLYAPTQKEHFTELIKDIRPFLKNENLLFAEINTQPVGFLFWHPDFNQTIRGGKGYSLIGLAARMILNKSKIDTLKINAIGSIAGAKVTYSLLNELKKFVHKYKYIESNFIWDNNTPSRLLTSKFLGEPHRKYCVYEDEI